MKKAILKSYIFIVALSLFFCATVFFYFVAFSFIKLEKNHILNSVDIITNFQKDENYLNKALDVGCNLKVQFIDKDEKEHLFNENSIGINKGLFNTLKNKFSKNENKKFYIIDKKLYYIDYLNQYEKFITAYKPLGYIKLILYKMILYLLFIFIILIFIILLIRRKFYNNYILPLNQILEKILKFDGKRDSINFKEYKFEEINRICRAIKFIINEKENILYKLEAEKKKINYILDNINEGFLLFDKNRKVFTINKFARKILKCEKEILGENILYYTQNMKIIDAIEKVYSTKERCKFDIETEDERIYSICISNAQKSDLNIYSGGIILIIDVTAERKSDLLKQEFFSNISHEIKTPITSIKGYTELLYNDFAKDTKQKKEFLKIILNETQNITSLINDILTISKIENNYIEIDRKNIKIGHIVDEIIMSVKPNCIDNNINIINKSGDISLYTDYKMLHQLLNNLIVNAVKYNKQNGNVEINCKEDEKFIYISIKDSGIGIPLLDRNRIFERFYRVQKGRSKNLGGSGLGLSIVKHIVNFYGGNIKLKTKENIGSEFLIKIPKNYIG